MNDANGQKYDYNSGFTQPSYRKFYSPRIAAFGRDVTQGLPPRLVVMGMRLPDGHR